MADCLFARDTDLPAPEWLERCAFPVGMDEEGNLVEVE